MRSAEATVGMYVRYVTGAKEPLIGRCGRIGEGPDSEGIVLVKFDNGNASPCWVGNLEPVQPAPLRDDLELIEVIEKEMKFVDDPELTPDANGSMIAELGVDEKKLALIAYFEQAYGNTEQDTVTYGPEFVIVIRSILAGKRPVKLRYLTDFEGEEK